MAATTAFLLQMAAGCATIGRPPSALHERIEGAEMEPAELRTRVRALASPLSGQLEVLSDELAALGEEAATQLQLLRFKINAIPQLQEALFRSDPVAALVDGWALVFQHHDALTRIIQANALGAQAQQLVDNRFGAMEADFAGLWSQLTGREDVSPARRLIRTWAAEHPLAELPTRQTTMQLLADVSEQSGVGPLGAAGLLLGETQDLADRIDYLTAYGTKQARWQAEYLFRSLLADPTLLDANGTGDLVVSLADALELVGQLPSWVGAERSIILQTLRQERLATQDFAQQLVQGERQVILDALQQERRAALAQSQEVGRELVDHAFDRATGLIDAILLRLLLLAGLLVIGAVVVALILARRRPREPLETRRRAPIEV